ncbi:phosphatidate cytidylyltransferase [Arsenicicoccus piscis]|uniref:Phosphatidate cytidylyltransferase n=2 Tax=Arsenicicoccus piscis TaxID=673954 RepID=A0ABQ6HKY0_9MICO|nr:phosphatidate cytidylyltransferase [Arsenicicoccus piscis]MCH8626958.1 phosphatidate cytidylyltransferase [Arsenicicoccus piscis]GMA19121.1 hypothetical protein GCM10025862_11420 [Arsenicicoccus piscis]
MSSTPDSDPQPEMPSAPAGSAVEARSADAVREARRARVNNRAGRNLGAAISVGVGLGLLIVVSLFTRRETFLPVVMVAVAIGMWEIASAVRHQHVRVPLVPTLAGGLALLPIAFVGGPRSLTLAFALVCLAIIVWRALDGGVHALRDVSGGVLTVAYVPLLAAFCMMMLAPPDGHWRVFIFILVTVCSDIGGYVAGVLFGKHPMAPSVSPKKSWEGFAGSALTCMVAGSLSVHFILHADWWIGALLGVASAATATVGDFCESVIKRDIGIKDMGHVLPGHGGIMDRLDSLLMVAPMAWVVLSYLLPGSAPG